MASISSHMLQAPVVASPASTAKRGAAQLQACKKANALVQDLAAADEANHAAKEQVDQWDAKIADLITELATAHKQRAAASTNAHDKSTRCGALDDRVQHLTHSISSMLEMLRNAKKRNFDEMGL